MRGVLKTTFWTEAEQNTFSERFWSGFGYLLDPFGFILVGKWGSRGASFRGRNFDGEKDQAEAGGNERHLAEIWVPGPKE